MSIAPSLIISFVALLLSIFSIYQQWIKPRHPKIAFLINPNEIHRSVLRPYDGLPPKYQRDYPEYPETHPGYAVLHLPFGNTGNEAGLVKIVTVDIENPPGLSEIDRIKASFYNYCIIPPGDVVLHPVILRNIPRLDAERVFEAIVKVEWGEPNPKTGMFVHRGGKGYPLQILVTPREDVKVK